MESGDLVFDPEPARLDPAVARAESELRRARFGAHPLFILRQKGRFPDIAHDHGRLLANEIDSGAFPEIAATIARGIDRADQLREAVGALLHQTYTERVEKSLTPEFREAVTAVAEGYLAGSGTTRYEVPHVVDAMLAIEVENVLVGLMRRFAIPGERRRAILDVIRHALPETFDRDVWRALRDVGRLASQPRKVERAAEILSDPRDHVGFGCSAVTAPAGATRDGRHLHARNLDNHVYSWSRWPVIALIDETPAKAAYQRYVGFGTAGVIYPGGVSGINEAGLSVSIHQLTTTRYKARRPGGRGELGPAIPQRILREARTLDEAVDVARGIDAFTSWCVLVSSTAEGAAMRIEINAEGLRVTRSEAPMPQANHYLHPDMMERAFNRTDAHFTPSFGKWLETRTRVEMLGAKLKTGAADGAIDTDWAIAAMASNEDAALSPAAPRAFGRVPCKSYGQMTSIVRGDPDRTRRADEVWMSLGDRRPACCSAIAGFAVDWKKFEIAPVADRPLRRGGATAEGFNASLHEFAEGVVAYSRPVRDGAPLDRDPTEEERSDMLAAALARFDRALELAAKDGIDEVPYRYMRARVRVEAGERDLAREDFEALLATWREAPERIHPYEAMLILAYSAQNEDLLRKGTGWPGREARLAEARRLLAQVRAQYFGSATPHHDLVKWSARLEELEREGGAAFEAPKPNFIVIE